MVVYNRSEYWITGCGPENGGLIQKKRPLKMDDKSMDPTGVQCRLSSDKRIDMSAMADMGPKKTHQKGCSGID